MNVHEVARYIACWQVAAEVPPRTRILISPVFKDTAAMLASSKATLEEERVNRTASLPGRGCGQR